MVDSSAGLVLLLVEDRDEDAALFKALVPRYERLKQARVERCRTLTEASQVLAETPVDCVILDLGLPDSEGLSGLWAIRGIAPSVPVVVLSGVDSDELAIAAVREGAQDYIVKGAIDPVRLGRKIIYAVERQQTVALLAEQRSNATFLATHDALTGLANRRHLEETAQRTLAADIVPKLSLLLIDLDGFKSINDTHGHAAGDAVLTVVAKRIQACTREKDMAARLGGDEFAVLLIPQLAAEAGEQLVARLHQALGHPILIGSLRLNVTASIGAAHHPEDGASLHALLRVADQRMYADKAQRLRRKRD